MVTNKNIRWLSCACPFCPVYLLLLFAMHSLDLRGSNVVQSVDGTWRYTPRINRISNERLTDKHNIPAGFTPDTTNRQLNWKTKKRARNGRIQNTYRITTRGETDDRQKPIIQGHIQISLKFPNQIHREFSSITMNCQPWVSLQSRAVLMHAEMYI